MADYELNRYTPKEINRSPLGVLSILSMTYSGIQNVAEVVMDKGG